MDPVVARKCWRTLEPYHGLVYFAPEAAARYESLGLEGRSGYFASRSAPMGAVPAAVVTATFFNFRPQLVERAMDGVWDRVGPATVLAARLAGAGAGLRAAIGGDLDEPGVARAADLVRAAAADLDPSGRPLFAGHTSLPWPDEPSLALWHGTSLLREHRGDGHIACLVEAGLDGCEALVVHAGSGEIPRSALQGTRAWTDDEWDAAAGRLADRGLVDADGGLTDAGRALRQRVEDRTDELALAPWAAIGEAACAELRSLVRPLSKAIVSGGAFGL